MAVTVHANTCTCTCDCHYDTDTDTDTSCRRQPYIKKIIPSRLIIRNTGEGGQEHIIMGYMYMYM